MATGTTVQDAKWQHRSFTPNPQPDTRAPLYCVSAQAFTVG